MKRSNEVDSDHRNFMTPEYRDFCIKTREHVVSCALFLVLFMCTYALVYRACALPQRQQNHQPALSSARLAKSRRSTRYLVYPYSSTFRSRQISLVIASAGLASACMTAILIAVTVALANAMEHGDPHSLTSWRTWLLPSTLLAPGETHTPGQYSHSRYLPRAVSSILGGPHMAHDFPPVLRRLWLYQSIISVCTATVLLPIGILFEHTSRMESSLRRLLLASIRWAMCVGLALCLWGAVCQRSSHLQALGFYRPFASGGATIRYSVYHAACIFVSLPTVLLIVPRGTWALFSWIKCCVSQKHELAHMARLRYNKLKHERAKIERQLQKAIGSWKWERIRDSDEAWVLDDFCDIGPKEITPSLRSPPTSRSRNSISDLPPLHPGLSPNLDSFTESPRPFRSVAYRQSRIKTRPRLARGHNGTLPGSAILRPKEIAMDYAPSFHQDGKGSTLISPTLQSASMFLYQSDGTDSSDDGSNHRSSWTNHSAQRVQRQRQTDRERAMKQLSRQIRKYHAQLLFIREEMRRLDESDVLNTTDDKASNARSSKRATFLSLVGRVSSILVTVTASLCWLLVVLQVGRGALSAIFVGEPDLTNNFTYFIPALSSDSIGDGGVFDSAAGREGVGPSIQKTHDDVAWKLGLIPPLVTLCQIVSSALLFVVVMFGVLSMGSSVEDSVNPLRFLIDSYSGTLLRARQWSWLPYVLLPDSMLARIDPTCVVSHFAPRNQLGSVAGNTSRVFFSSSRDLTSFYRGLLRQSSASSAVPTTLLPGGILPESFLQAKTWGRRVFLLFASNTALVKNAEGSGTPKAATAPRAQRAVSTKQLVTYAWIVCGLAMTWPSVLRTTGLISERAYILPIASLVQPLWIQYKGEQELFGSANMHVHGGAADSDEDIVGLLTSIAPPPPSPPPLASLPSLPVSGAVAEECDLGICLTKDIVGESLLHISNDRMLICDNQLEGLYPNDSPNSLNHLHKGGINTSSRYGPLEADRARSATSFETDPAATAARPAIAFERKVSRKQMHQSLAADTINGKVIRWGIGLACKITPHTCITAGYIAWWMAPDLIVPLSSVTVDMQLGYIPPQASSSNPFLVSSPAAYSEWYGMLRRVERGNVWLPHADDGTPLRLQQPGTSSRRKPSERERQAQDSPPGNGFGAYKKQRWMQMAFGSVAHGIRVAGLWFKELVCGLVQRLWAAALLCIRVATSTAMERVQDTRAGAVIGAVVNAAASVASGIRDRAGGVWETVLSPLLYYVSLGASALVGGASFAVSIVNSILGSLLLPGKNASVAQVGVTGAVPPLFISEYWDSAAMSGSSPAIQRLRPELWPHVFGGNPDGATFLYDVVKAPQPQQQRQIQQQQQPAATAVPWRKEDLRPGSLSANSDSSASQNWNPEDATASAVDTAASAPGAAAGQQEHAAGTAEADDESGSQRQARKAWTTLDWLLAAYRVALSVIALRTVFRPSRSSRMFVL